MGTPRPDPTKLETVAERVRYARRCRHITIPLLVKYWTSWAPNSWDPPNRKLWLAEREKYKRAYPIEVVRALSYVLDVPTDWLMGEVPPYPPPIQPMSEVELLFLDNGSRLYAERWIQSKWRGKGERGIRI